MTNNKFIILFKGLNSISINRFDKYLNSPYFNTDKNLIDFFKTLNKKVDFSKPLPTKEKLWKSIFKNKPFKPLKFNRLFSDLNTQLENFITIESLKSNVLLYESTKVEALNKPGQQKNFLGAIRSFDKSLSQANSSIDMNYYKYRTQRSAHDFLYKTGGNFSDFTNLTNADASLEKMFIILKLKHHIEHLDYNRKFKNAPDIPLSLDFIKIISRDMYQKDLTIRAFYLIHQLLFQEEDKDNAKFNEVHDLLKLKSDDFLFEDKKNLFLSLINYCIDLQINKGNTPFFKILFEIYKTALAQNIFHSNKILHFQSYKNIITAGLYIKEFEWVENFILVSTNELQENLRENASNYNLAKLAYKKKEYDKVISLMSIVTYDNVNYALGSRMFLLRTYFETDSATPFESLVFSFSAYIQRNKEISQIMKRQYLNFIKTLKKIYYLNPYDKEKGLKLKDKITNATALIHKNYLMEQWHIKTNTKI